MLVFHYRGKKNEEVIERELTFSKQSNRCRLSHTLHFKILREQHIFNRNGSFIAPESICWSRLSIGDIDSKLL